MPSRRFRKRGGGDSPAEGKGFLDQATGFMSDTAGKATNFMSDAAGQVSKTAEDAKEGTEGVVGNASRFLSKFNPFAKKEDEAQSGGKKRKTKRRRAKKRTRR